jgi:hypothetical protein
MISTAPVRFTWRIVGLPQWPALAAALDFVGKGASADAVVMDTGIPDVNSLRMLRGATCAGERLRRRSS